MRHVGRSLPRVDGRTLVTGAARYVGNVRRAGELHMRLVRSPFASGRIEEIHTADAAAMPGVEGVITGAELGAIRTVPLRVAPDSALEPYHQPVLARDAVRYLGEPVAAVCADDEALAEDAAECVDVVLESEPAPLRRAPIRIAKEWGPVDELLRRAHTVAEIAVALPSVPAVPLETKSILAEWEGGNALHVWNGAAEAGWQRQALADLFGLPLGSVTVHPVAVGGRFGAKGELCAQDILTAFAARIFQRPVRYHEDQREHLLTAPRGFAIEARVRAGVDRAGALLVIDVAFTADQGAYLTADGLLASEIFAALVAGPYALKACRVTGTVAFSAAPPAGAVRGAGRCSATFVSERLLDAIAAHLGCDPLALRRANLPAGSNAQADREGQQLFDTPLGRIHRSAREVVDQSVKRFSLASLERRAEARRARGELVGVGVSLFVEPGPARAGQKAHVSLDRAGNAALLVSAGDAGQGLTTILAQIVADNIGVDIDRVTCRTFAGAERDGGTADASPSAALSVAATQYAAEALREKILRAAAQLMSLPPDALLIRSGAVREGDRRFAEAIELGAIARAMEPFSGTALAAPGGLSATATARGEEVSLGFGLQAAVAEVDKLTGAVALTDAYVAYDAGTAINPALVSDQLGAGVLHGLGHILPAPTAAGEADADPPHSYADVMVPTATEVPRIQTLVFEEAPDPHHPIGMRHVGAAGMVGLPAATAAAVDAAIGSPGFVMRLPVDPYAVLEELQRQRQLAFAQPRPVE